jgi:hypothetical protein
MSVHAHVPRQRVAIPQSAFWQELRKHAQADVPVCYYGTNIYQFINPGQDVYPFHAQDLLCSSGKIYIHIRSTGVLYEVENPDAPDSIVFRRLDKTDHFGYNLNAYGFSSGGRIFNIGGYGYWKWNGQLRAYNSKMQEWEIVSLDREIFVSKDSPDAFFWKNRKKNELYILQYLTGNEAVRNEPFRLVDTVYRLDLNTYKWQPLGRQGEHLREFLNHQTLVAELDSGLLVNTRGEMEYYNIPDNRVLMLRDLKLKAELKVGLHDTYNWYAGGKLYYGDPRSGKIDSIELGKPMFSDTGKPIYGTGKSPKKALQWLPLFVVAAAIALFLISIYGGKSNAESIPNPAAKGPETEPEIPSSPGQQQEVFDEIERALLKCLLTNMKLKNERTGTHEINRILGVGNKTPDMQKRKRSDVIRSVNRKYHLLHPDRTTDPIVKDRSSVDGRLSEYYVRPSEIETLSRYIG